MKTKILVLVGIAICTILLTSPALASAGYSKIYGNANEDEVLDMRDVTYIKLVIFGKKPATALADANYDGKISMLDLGQTKLIILGKEKRLTLVDQADRVVTVPRPIERVVSCPPDPTKILIALGECDKLVGVIQSGKTCTCYRSAEDAPVCVAEVCGGRLFELPEIERAGCGCGGPEIIVSLHPDMIFDRSSTADVIQGKTGIPVVVISSSGHNLEEMYKAIEATGLILEREKEAEELISFIEEKIDKLSTVTSEIPDSDKPKVYFATRGADPTAYAGGVTRTITRYEPLDVAGGINVAKDVLPQSPGSTSVEVSKEQIIKWNPDIIIIAHSHGKPLDEVNDVEMILSDPDLQTVNAIKNESVYFSLYPYCCGTPLDRNIVNAVYLAKLFHPDKFKDLDVEEGGNEI